MSSDSQSHAYWRSHAGPSGTSAGDLVPGFVRRRHHVCRTAGQHQARRLSARLLVRPPGIHLCVHRAHLLLRVQDGTIDRRSTCTKSKERPWICKPPPYIVVGLSFALYIGIAIWGPPGSTSEFYVAGGRASGHQWHGHRGGLDVGRVVHRPGSQHGLRRRPVPDGLDRRLRAAGLCCCAPTCASSASSPCPSSSATASARARAPWR